MNKEIKDFLKFAAVYNQGAMRILVGLNVHTLQTLMSLERG